MFKYDIVLSYASEQRPYVEQVAKMLQEKGLKIFYDCHQEIELWGKNLDRELWEVFVSDARCFVLFVSKEYKEKEYTQLEYSALINNIMSNTSCSDTVPIILPVLMDNSQIPLGINKQKYIAATNHTPAELTEMIIKKLEMEGQIISIDRLFEQIKYVAKETCKHSNLNIVIDLPQQFSAEIDIGSVVFYFTFKKCTISGKADCIYLYDFNTIGVFGLNWQSAVISLADGVSTLSIKNMGYFDEAKLYATLDINSLKQMMIKKFKTLFEMR